MSFENPKIENPIPSEPEEAPKKENEAERSVPEILKEKAEITEKGIKEISPKEKEKLFDSVERISNNIPEIIIVGGAALSIHLENLKKKIPEGIGKDIDCVLEKEIYERVREALPPVREKEVISAYPETAFPAILKEKLSLSYRRKEGEKEEPRAFLRDPAGHMALEDRKTYRHIDIFPKQEITSAVEKFGPKGQKINLLSPEELFIRRMSDIKKGIDTGELQERHVRYFYLNGGLIEETKMDKLWSEVKKMKEDIGDWREFWRDLDKGIDLARSQGKIKEKIIHGIMPEAMPEKNREKILEKTPEAKPGHDQLVAEVASLTHDDWRAPRKIEGTDSYEPRIKKLKIGNGLKVMVGRKK